jgi:2-succinyl-6-hydroxy-2,4-cyclohexadiene-1-carboxylate synthase
MTLAAHILFPGISSESQRIVLLHGFTQNSQCWGPFAEWLADETGCEIVAIDAPGHGESPKTHDHSDLWQAARLIAEVGGHAHYVGYSMGGRMALHVALEHPQLIRSLTLIGATPGIPDPVERESRKAADAKLADRLSSMGLETFLHEWLDQPMFAGLTDFTTYRAERMQNRTVGLAASLRHCGTGSQDSLWPRLGELTHSLLLVGGSEDIKFAHVATSIAACAFPDISCIDGAGHSAHLERPWATTKVVAAFVTAAR